MSSQRVQSKTLKSVCVLDKLSEMVCSNNVLYWMFPLHSQQCVHNIINFTSWFQSLCLLKKKKKHPANSASSLFCGAVLYCWLAVNKQRCAFQMGFSFFGAMIDALARRVWGGICPPREKWRECEKHLPLPLSICSLYVCWPVVVICWSDRSSLWLQILFLHPLMANCLVWRLVSVSGSVCD